MTEPAKDQAEVAPIDTTNYAMVASGGDGVMVMRPQHLMRMTKEQALVVAAWIVAIVADDELWQRSLEAVENS